MHIGKRDILYFSTYYGRHTSNLQVYLSEVESPSLSAFCASQQGHMAISNMGLFIGCKSNPWLEVVPTQSEYITLINFPLLHSVSGKVNLIS